MDSSPTNSARKPSGPVRTSPITMFGERWGRCLVLQSPAVASQGCHVKLPRSWIECPIGAQTREAGLGPSAVLSAPAQAHNNSTSHGERWIPSCPSPGWQEPRGHCSDQQKSPVHTIPLAAACSRGSTGAAAQGTGNGSPREWGIPLGLLGSSALLVCCPKTTSQGGQQGLNTSLCLWPGEHLFCLWEGMPTGELHLKRCVLPFSVRLILPPPVQGGGCQRDPYPGGCLPRTVAKRP